MKQPELGKKVLELRLAKGLTQSELAEKCKLSLRTIQRIESLEVTPRSFTVNTVLSFLGYSDDSEGNPWFLNFLKALPRLFNLKTNTMKKISVLSMIVIFVSSGLFLSKRDTNAQSIEGWFKTGSKPKSYEIGIDTLVFKTGKSSAYLESIEKVTNGFGTLMQTCSSEDYLGKRIKMTAYVKSENVQGWAGMWMRIDTKTKKSASFDNMQDRPIKGTNRWKKYEIILDVPDEYGTLNFGILLSGTGKVWFDNILFEEVDKQSTMPTGKSKGTFNRKPTNLNFGE